MLYITDQHPRSPGVWALCVDGTVVEQYPGNLGATLAARALHKHADVVLAAADPGQLVPWEDAGGIAFIGVPTSDKRVLDDMGFRAFPMDLLAQTETAFGHDGAFLVGRIDHAMVEGNAVRAKGVIDPAIPGAADVLRAMENDMLTRVSIDYTADARLEILAEDADGMPTDYLEHHYNVKMGAATLVSMSAFEDARVRLSSVYSLVAAGGHPNVDTNPAMPPLSFFQDPNFTGRTRLRVDPPDENGHVRYYGHLAPHGECHIGIQGQCVTPPLSATNYGWFTLGSITCQEGCVIPIGTVTFRGSHADKHLSARAAAAHYDNTCMAIADVAVGEDEFGIWVSGALRRWATDDDIRELLAARLSGDWRPMNGSRELVAVHAVPVGGFPVYEEAVAADGRPGALIASFDPRDDAPESEDRVVSPIVQSALRRYLQPMFTERADALRERVHSVT